MIHTKQMVLFISFSKLENVNLFAGRILEKKKSNGKGPFCMIGWPMMPKPGLQIYPVSLGFWPLLSRSYSEG